ncbi:MAG: hypothetical protein UU23_C0001G0097 [Candidatus Curtissbacteria bacterium GW2011_GWA1_40_9]|uniref:Lipid II isoglutaminyl synthase (glutamine-hydrolyzing) subunit MurT n=1 Tax=Candidatus Curtissbacteria bacterium GW2011_GWA1_40_9 TaxID=1618408 RepID=A0A0G0TMW1_9BACT|nr:MAG: hypothetical protein UU23_C0001G0097 [Candidatus Curtissbacteria bacterium GW2011_GWA1_40_9]
MDLRLSTALFTGKLIAFILKVSDSGATAAPGLFALKIDSNLVKKLNDKNRLKSIIISGTNGKTTTARLTSDILKTKYKIIHNRQGSNLLRGVASTLIAKSNIFGQIGADIAIWEADEASLPEILENSNPKIVVLLNLFRDQLDRYGEINTIRTKWEKALEKLPKSTTFILNTDDPGICFLSKFTKGKVLFFGVEDKKIDLPQVENVADIKNCPNCAEKLTYSSLFSAHLGHFLCPNCQFSRPLPDVHAQKLKFKPDFSTNLELIVNNSKLKVNYNLPGLYNVYNTLAATSVAKAENISTEDIGNKLKKFSAVFGRFQTVEIKSRKITTFLIKNPAGANEIIRTISQKKNINLVAILNDKIADGRDVSWIWDTNWEKLVPNIKSIFASGIRAFDFANRFKYAEINIPETNIKTNIKKSIKFAIQNTAPQEELLILPTYTALLEVQKILSGKEQVKWHKQ